MHYRHPPPADSTDTFTTTITLPITSTNDSDNAPSSTERQTNLQNHSKERHGSFAWANAWVIGLPTLVLTAIYGWFSIRLQQGANDIAIKQLIQSVSTPVILGADAQNTN